MEGKFYVRQKSSLNGKRVKKDPAFARTMQYANLLGNASKIASAFYRKLNSELKERGLYKKLTGIVMQLLKEGKDEDSIAVHLQQVVFPEPLVNDIPDFKNEGTYSYADALLEIVFTKPASLESFALKDYGFV